MQRALRRCRLPGLQPLRRDDGLSARGHDGRGRQLRSDAEGEGETREAGGGGVLGDGPGGPLVLDA